MTAFGELQSSHSETPNGGFDKYRPVRASLWPSRLKGAS